MLLLRPHHLFCIKKYIGKGYSQDFINNMDDIVKRLNNDEPFILIGHQDNVCKTCPNLVDDKCLTQEKVNRFDDNVLKALNLELNKQYKLSILNDQIESIIKDDKKFLSICPDCSWSYICHK